MATSLLGGVEPEASPSVQLSYLLTQVYWPYISRVVQFSSLVPRMDFMRGVSSKIMRAEESGAGNEAQLFMDHFMKVEEPGKFQAFKQALQDTGYDIIVSALENKNPVTAKLEEHEKLLKDVFPNLLMETLDPIPITEDLLAKNIISNSDADRIRKIDGRHVTSQAVFYLLEAIPRRCENWYETFLSVLLDHGHNNLVKLIDEKFFSLNTDSGEDQGSSGDIYTDVPGTCTTQSGNSDLEGSDVFKRPAVSLAEEVDLQLMGYLKEPSSVVQRDVILHDFPNLESRDSDSNKISEILQLVRSLAENQSQLIRKVERLERKVDQLLLPDKNRK